MSTVGISDGGLQRSLLLETILIFSAYGNRTKLCAYGISWKARCFFQRDLAGLKR